MILKTEHQQQLGNSFNHSNNDLHNIINVGHNARTIIISEREDHEEVETYSPTSNYRIPDIYRYNSQKRRRDKAAPPSQPKQSTTDSTHQKIHSKCFLHPKGKYSTFQCSTLRKALGAPPTSANKDNKKKANTSQILSNEESSMPVTQTSHLLGLPPVLHPIKARMGSPEL